MAQLPGVDVVLSWSGSRPGTTVVMRKTSVGGWEEIGRTTAEQMLVRGVDPTAVSSFAVASVLESGGLDHEDDWRTLRVVPLEGPDAPALPESPLRFAAAQDGAVLNFQWAAATDGVTRTYELRVGDSWEDGVLVAAGIAATSYVSPWNASGDVTLHLKAVDRFGRVSRQAASIDVTVASLDTHVDDAVDDHAAGGWTGDKEHLEVDGGELRLERVLPFGALDMPFGSLSGLPCFAHYWPQGVYTTQPIDLGQKERQRVEVDLGVSQPIASGLPFGAIHRPVGRRPRGWTSRQSWRLTPLEPVDVRVEINTAPAGTGDFDGWRPYVPGTYEFWRVRMRVTATGDGLRFVRIPKLVIARRKFNFKDEGFVTVPGGGPIEIDYNLPFTESPKTTATLVGSFPDVVRFELTPISATKFELEAFDALDVSIPGNFHWHALGV